MDRLREAVELHDHPYHGASIKPLLGVVRYMTGLFGVWDSECHFGGDDCRMVEASLVVDDPTTNSVQDGSSLGVDDPQGGEQ